METLEKRIQKKRREGTINKYKHYVCNFNGFSFVATANCYEELFLYLHEKGYLNLHQFIRTIPKKTDLFHYLQKHFISSKKIQEVSYDD